NARQSAFWLGEAMIAYGCMSLRAGLERFDGLRNELAADLPLFGTRVNGALLVAFAIFVVLTVSWVRWLSRARAADRLIEVESEIRKVTWPSFKEASNSSVVVIVAVLILMGFLALSDFLLGGFFNVVLWQFVEKTS
ncbi:MAG TPA: preprotein translocase subunit SecE, partial [Planctomycetota bacterium]